MKLLQKVSAFILALVFAASAVAQIHDTGVGGGVNVNVTAGSINCQLSGTSGCTIVPNTLLGIVGTTTNDNANAGAVGEVLQSTVVAGSAVALTTTTAANVTSLSLTVGDWEVEGACDHTWTGTTATIEVCGISGTTATQPTQPGGVVGNATIGTEPLVSQSITFGATITGRFDQRVKARVQVTTASTTIFLVATATFSAGTDAVFGTIRARRIR